MSNILFVYCVATYSQGMIVLSDYLRTHRICVGGHVCNKPSCVLNMFVCVDTKAEFVNVPASTNVSLGEVWEFNCTAENVTNIYNLVNGKTISSNHPGFAITRTMLLSNTSTRVIRTTLLRVTASHYTNGSNITCVIITQSPLSKNESQPPALFLVQGIIDTSN